MMAKRIENLTQAQIDRFPEFVEKWTKIGLCTDPADRPEAERGVRLAYVAAGISPPKVIVWCGSPLSQGLTRAIIFGLKNAEAKIGASVSDSVRDIVWNSVGASVGASVRNSVSDSVRDSVSDSVWNSVGDSVRNSVSDSVRNSVSDSVWNSVSDSVWNSVRDSVRNSVSDSVWNSVWNSVRDSVVDSVSDSVSDSVRNSVSDSVRNSVRGSVRNSVRDIVWNSVRNSVRGSVYGQHDAGWLSFYDYFKIATGLDENTQKLSGMWLVAKSAGWWLPHKNLCWISERHNILSRNTEGRLHCENGPALAYPDGWSIWSIGGVTVDEQVVMSPETQTVDQIKKEENEERRRVRIERFGWERYLKESGAKIRHKRHNDRDAQDEHLYRLDDGSQRFVCVDPSTGRRYALGVPAEVDTCESAQEWMSCGLDKLAVHRS